MILYKEHPFCLKGGYGFLSESKYFCSLRRAAEKKIATSFSTKTIIFKAQSAKKKFCPFQRQNFFFQAHLQTENVFPQKNIAPPLLVGCKNSFRVVSNRDRQMHD